MPKHIGIVACSPVGAELCYRALWREAHRRMGDKKQPEITIHSVSLGKYMDHFKSKNWQGVADLMLESSKKLEAIGADFCICPDNTVHEAFDLVTPNSKLPWLSILEEVRNGAIYKNYKTLGILGTEYIMTSPLYQKKFNSVGIETKIPKEKDIKRINEIIFTELANGIFDERSRIFVTGIINQYKDYGADAIVLGGTELPLLIKRDESPLPLLDSTSMLAHAALRKALLED
jgi:aspartate racemase